MTREEAIEILRKNRPTSDPRPCGMELCDAVDMAISALRQQEHFREVTKKMEPLTNAQKIRSMTDEELAEFLDADAEYCHVGLCKDGETCRICCLRWLQMPAEEDKHD